LLSAPQGQCSSSKNRSCASKLLLLPPPPPHSAQSQKQQPPRNGNQPLLRRPHLIEVVVELEVVELEVVGSSVEIRHQLGWQGWRRLCRRWRRGSKPKSGS
jgi:hypothetical protein